jgi:hypothetical protein
MQRTSRSRRYASAGGLARDVERCLGSENRDLPAYVVLLSGPIAGAGTSLWSAGFLPSVYQGIQFRSAEMRSSTLTRAISGRESSQTGVWEPDRRSNRKEEQVMRSWGDV